MIPHSACAMGNLVLFWFFFLDIHEKNGQKALIWQGFEWYWWSIGKRDGMAIGITETHEQDKKKKPWCNKVLVSYDYLR